MNRDVHMEAVSKEKVPTSSSSLHGAESFHPSEENLGDWDVFSYVLHGYGVGDQEKKKVPIGDMRLCKSEPKEKVGSNGGRLTGGTRVDLKVGTWNSFPKNIACDTAIESSIVGPYAPNTVAVGISLRSAGP